MKKHFLITLIILLNLSFIPAALASASGAIDSTNRYAWSENAGWIDFGTTQGAVQVTDSAVTGYAWGENIGWISLNCSNDNSCINNLNYGVANDGKGNLSGYAWSENVGWIDFAPSNGGVIISSSGVFSGYAWGENIGWINFNVNNPVTTSWQPTGGSPTPTPAPTSSGGGLPPVAFTPPQAPSPTSANPTGGFQVFINSGASLTNSAQVSLSFIVGSDIARMAISNTADFTGIGQETYEGIKNWNLCSPSYSCSAGSKTVYVKFYTSFGQPSAVVSATINYDPNASAQAVSNAQNSAVSLSPAVLPTAFNSNDLVLDHSTIYLIEGQQKLGFTNMKAFKGLGYKLKYVIPGDTSAYTLSDVVLSSPTQAHPVGSWIISKKTVYYVTSTGLIPVPSWNVFLNNIGSSKYIVKANAADLLQPLLSNMINSDSRVGE
jgi:hypothetical protein